MNLTMPFCLPGHPQYTPNRLQTGAASDGSVTITGQLPEPRAYQPVFSALLRHGYILITVVAILYASTAVEPAVRTESAPDSPDDPAVWVHPKDPSRSLILGTIKSATPRGGLLTYDLDGGAKQIIPLDRPNNVDVEYGLLLAGQRVDIAVVTERNRQALRVYRIHPQTGELSEAGDIPVFTGEKGSDALPMGIALYKRPRDRAVFAMVSRKSGPRTGYLWQYRLLGGADGRVTAEKVRAFGNFSGSKEIEAVAVDDELGYVYYADEDTGIRQWRADPAHPDAYREIAVFGQEGFAGNREGIAILARPGGRGYVVCADQRSGDSEYRIYTRDNQHTLLGVVRGGADATDGIEIVSRPLGSRFPSGLLIAMNNRDRNFLLYRWSDVSRAAGLR